MTKKIWTLEEAQEDYRRTHPKKFKSKRKCSNCKFQHKDWEGDIYCKVKESYVLFKIINAKLCKYYTHK